VANNTAMKGFSACFLCVLRGGKGKGIPLCFGERRGGKESRSSNKERKTAKKIVEREKGERGHLISVFFAKCVPGTGLWVSSTGEGRGNTGDFMANRDTSIISQKW